MNDRVFNPYHEAKRDPDLRLDAARKHRKSWRPFCCRCGLEKPIRGGQYPNAKGFGMRAPGAAKRFICADCIAAKAAATTQETTP